MPQSEQQLENTLISQLNKLGFSTVKILDRGELESNLRTQLEKFNKTKFSDSEWTRVLNHLNKGDRFEKSKTLRDRFPLKRDNEKVERIRFFNTDQWSKMNVHKNKRKKSKKSSKDDKR